MTTEEVRELHIESWDRNSPKSKIVDIISEMLNGRVWDVDALAEIFVQVERHADKRILEEVKRYKKVIDSHIEQLSDGQKV